jgi:hypothetical protein
MVTRFPSESKLRSPFSKSKKIPESQPYSQKNKSFIIKIAVSHFPSHIFNKNFHDSKTTPQAFHNIFSLPSYNKIHNWLIPSNSNL